MSEKRSVSEELRALAKRCREWAHHDHGFVPVAHETETLAARVEAIAGAMRESEGVASRGDYTYRCWKWAAELAPEKE